MSAPLFCQIYRRRGWTIISPALLLEFTRRPQNEAFQRGVLIIKDQQNRPLQRQKDGHKEQHTKTPSPTTSIYNLLVYLLHGGINTTCIPTKCKVWRMNIVGSLERPARQPQPLKYYEYFQRFTEKGALGRDEWCLWACLQTILTWLQQTHVVANDQQDQNHP